MSKFALRNAQYRQQFRSFPWILLWLTETGLIIKYFPLQNILICGIRMTTVRNLAVMAVYRCIDAFKTSMGTETEGTSPPSWNEPSAEPDCRCMPIHVIVPEMI